MLPPQLASFAVLLVETGFPYVVQAALELLGSSNSPTLALQSVGVAGMSQHAGPIFQ